MTIIIVIIIIKRKRHERKKTLYEGKLQGQFVAKTRNMAHGVSGKWIRHRFLKKETEDILFSAQEHALRTNSIKENIDKQPVSPKCGLCGTKEEETLMQLVSGCPKMAQKQYKRRHDNVSRRFHLKLCRKLCRKHGLL